MRTQLRRFAALLVLSAMPALHAFAGTSDFDGDGRADVFWRNTTTGANVLWRSGDPATQQSVLGVTNARWTVVGTGDFDGDGNADLLWRNRATGANVIWRSANPATPRAMTSVPNLDWHVAGIGDFDGDGMSDVFWRNLRTGGNVVWRSANSASVRPVSPAGTLAVVAGIGDFDGDHADDVVWRNRATGANALWHSADATRFQALSTVADPYWQIEAVADFDGDGRADLFWRHLLDGRDVVWRSGLSGAPIAVATADISRHVAASGDYDGDGRADLFWRDFFTGGNGVWLSADAATGRRLTVVTNFAWSVLPFDAQPTEPMFEMADARVVEGNSGTLPAAIRVRLSHVAVVPVRVTFAFVSSDDPIFAMPGSDYMPPPQGEIVILPGETTADIPFVVIGDTTPEANERVGVELQDVIQAFVLRAGPDVRILNDDANTLWVERASAVEGNSGTRPMTFRVHLSRPSTTPVTCIVETVTRPMTYFVATPNVDYQAKSAALAIPAGTTEAVFVVDVIGDTINEPIGEIFGIEIHDVVGAVLVVGSVNGIIIDDDPPIIP
jgi:hypothetical protein